MTWVVKLGGSLQCFPALRDWLAVAGGSGAGKVVIVPGGGRFADAVRDAQGEWRFDDAAAHRMALLAMDQYGHMLAALAPHLQLADSESTLRAALAGGRASVWLPYRMMSIERGVANTWDVTSDSLALWLANRLQARVLALVKVARPSSGGLALGELRAQRLVDDAFEALAASFAGEIGWFHVTESGEFQRALANGGLTKLNRVLHGGPASVSNAVL